MSRSGLFWLVCALLFAAIVGVRDFDPTAAPADEILAYEVTPEQSVELMLHGGVQEVSLTAWLLVPFGVASDEELSFSLSVEVFDSAGQSVASRTLRGLTQLPAAQGAGPSEEAAHLAGGTSLVCEARSFELDVRALAGRAGRLRLRAGRGDSSHLLLRLAHDVARTPLEQRLMERTLSLSDRRGLTEDRTSLGFYDIDADVRRAALSHWKRRLTAAGREGRDYVVRRLLLGPALGRAAPSTGIDERLETGPGRELALNTVGAVELRVASDTDTRVRLSRLGGEPPSEHRLRAGGKVDLTLPDAGPSTIVLSTEEPARLRITALRELSDRFLEADAYPLRGDRMLLGPDLRIQRPHGLDPRAPLALLAAPEQRQLGLSLRWLGELGEPAPRATARVTFLGADGRSLSEETLGFDPEPSTFEHVQGQPVSEAAVFRLHVPTGSRRVEVFGDERVLAVAFVDQTAAPPQREPPYDFEPPEGFALRYAPHVVSPWVVLTPDNLSELLRQERQHLLTTQVRIEPLRVTSRAVAPRVLEAAGGLIVRKVFVPSALPASQPLPPNGWALLDSTLETSTLALESPMVVAFAADENQLGGTWRLWLGEQLLIENALSLRTGRRTVSAPRARGKLRVEGLGPAGVLFARARPVAGGRIFKHQTVYGLPAGQTARFPFDRRPGELLSVAVIGVAQGDLGPLELSYRVDGGAPARVAGHYRRRATEWRGRRALAFGTRGRALVWAEPFDTAAGPLPDRMAAALIALGDDLPTGPHTLTITRPAHNPRAARNRLWIRAVVEGRVLQSP